MSLFEKTDASPDVAESEAKIRRFWKERRIFEKSVAARSGARKFLWYDGPPTANGRPHNGHVLTRVYKDVFPRFWTMRGRLAERVAGWDTHGLPVETEVEKELGIKGRAAIKAAGVDMFVERCMASVFRYIRDWEEMTDRIGHWVDLDHAYVTYRTAYVESVWWALSELFRKGLLYRSEKVVWWWPEGGTALSAAEVGLGYREVDDPAVYVAFPLRDDPDAALAVWTTTPWTLPSNLYAAVRPDAEYVEVDAREGAPDGSRGNGPGRLFVAAALREDLAKRLGRPLPPLRALSGRELVGRRYLPPFDDYFRRHGGLLAELDDGPSVPAFWRVLAADFVELDQGTGLVHEAPAFGEVDHDLHREVVASYRNAGDIPLPCAVGPDGRFTDDVPLLEGQYVKDADRTIIRFLKERGLLLHSGTIRHEYPFCWRAPSDPLIQYARPAWFIRTTRRKDEAIRNSAAVRWMPEHVKEGRFGDFLRNNVDWALSRERFWGTPLNLWINDETGRIEAPDSVAAIEARNPDAFASFRKAREKRPGLPPDLMVHKPWVDDATWTRPGEPGTYRRVPEVIDCWFDSGAMPFAQWGFPHRNRERFAANFPADYITEAVDQTRGWFYSLLMISTLLFDADTCGRLGVEPPAFPHPFRNCLVLGHVTDPEGRKESKSRGNYTPPDATLNEAGADAFRWLFLASTPPGTNKRHSLDQVRTWARDFPLKLRNVLSFFTIYAGIDGFDPRSDEGRPVEERAPLDRWILSHLEETTALVAGRLERFHAHDAARALAGFTESLSNWWLRRSRRRFWEAGAGADKIDAHRTLYDALTRLSRLAAPFTPFVAEEIHRNLVVRPFGDDAPESVHLADWPEPRFPLDRGLNEEMALVREIASLGLRVRSDSGVRVRQPLRSARVTLGADSPGERLAAHEALIADELNVRTVEFRKGGDGDEAEVEYQVKPDFRRLGPRFGRGIREIQQALAALPGAEARDRLEADGYLDLASDGSRRIGRDDVSIVARPRPGGATARSASASVTLDTRLDPDLIREGKYREVLNRVQSFRKELDLPYAARVRIALEDAGALLAIVRDREAHFLSETLGVELLDRASRLQDPARREIEVDGETGVLALEEASPR